MFNKLHDNIKFDKIIVSTCRRLFMIKIYISIDNWVPTCLGVLFSKNMYQNNQNWSTQIIIKNVCLREP